MPTFTNDELQVDVEIVELTQRQAVPYWEAMQASVEATGPALWHSILQAAVEGKWFVNKQNGRYKEGVPDPLDYTPAQARWLAEELATHLLEQSKVGEV